MKKITRKDLYDLIWSTSSHTITDKFDISRYRLLKICKENQVPAPSNDWWTESTIKEIALKPELDDSCRDDIMIEIVSDREIRQNRINEIKEDIEDSCGDYLTVPKRLFNPDQLIQNAKYTLKNKNPNSFSRDKGFISTDRGQVSIFVTKRNIGRSLRILDSFIKLTKARGHSIEMNNNENKIKIWDQYYEFSIREKQKRIESKEKWRDHVYEQTGLLVLSVGQWSDKKEFIDSGVTLENKLSNALAYLEYTEEVWRRIMEVNELQRIKREEEERKAQESRDRDSRELEKLNMLIKKANAWHQAKLLRDFITKVELLSKEMHNESESVKEWINWARLKTDL